MAGIDDGDPGTCARCHTDLPAWSQFCPECGASTASGRAPGPVLAGYTILRPLGQGGAAVVYLARQDSLERDVAVKVLRRDVGEPKVWGQFRKEARTLARLSGHPNVVTVYTTGRSDTGQPFLVTEFLDRGSLGDVITSEGPIAPAAVARVGMAVADALAAAHGLGILHRDVKPGNVLLDHEGHVKLGDFGIARLLAGQSVTTTDVVAFTPEHVAPEILRGEIDGPWSDLYGLASTMATALVGEPVFSRRPDERVEALLSRKLMGPPPPLPASVPRPLATLVGRGLDPDPTRRPSLTEFREELAALADVLGEVPLLPPAPPNAVTAVSVGAPSAGEAGEEADDGRRSPLIGPLRRRRGPLVAVSALAALVAAALAIASLTDEGGGEASSTTSPDVVTPLPETTVAPPSSAPARPATTATTATTAPATTTTPVATTMPVTTPAPVAAPATERVQTTLPTGPTTTTATAAAPPTNNAPVPPSAPPPNTSPPPGAVDVTTEQAAEAFVRSYFDTVADGDYQTSWPQLAPEFQRGKARSYEYYVDFWNENDLEVDTVELVDTDPNRTIVNVDVRWNGSPTAVTEQFVLRPGGDGELLIAGQDTVDAS